MVEMDPGVQGVMETQNLVILCGGNGSKCSGCDGDTKSICGTWK